MNLPEITGFVIYNPKLEMFSRGGLTSNPAFLWHKTPKIWKKLNHVTCHITNLIVSRTYNTKKFDIRNCYDGCEIWDVVKKEKLDMTAADIAIKYIERQKKQNPSYLRDYGINIK